MNLTVKNIKDHISNARAELKLAAHAAQEGGPVYVDFEDGLTDMDEELEEMDEELTGMED